jgi:hypothetical protein
MDIKKIKLIWDTFAKVLTKNLVEEGKGYILPARMGTLQMRKKQTKKGFTLDFNKTRQAGVKVYQNNSHSDGYYAFLFWDTRKPHCMMPYKGLYKLEFVRANKRYVAKQIKQNNAIVKYFEID